MQDSSTLSCHTVIWRWRVWRIASLGGLPEVSLPLARTAAGPVGLSLIAPRGRDAMLLDLVAEGLGALRQPAAP